MRAQIPTHERRRLFLPLLGMTLMGFGVTLLIIALAYMQDLAMIQRTPEAVWRFVCGAPMDNALLPPLLFGLSSIALLFGVASLTANSLRTHGRTLRRDPGANVVR